MNQFEFKLINLFYFYLPKMTIKYIMILLENFFWKILLGKRSCLSLSAIRM